VSSYCSYITGEERAMTKENADVPWLDFCRHGMQYRNTAERSLKRSAIFKPDIIYNLAAMAIEKILMAAFTVHGNLPYSHTLSEMAAAAKDILALDENLVSDMEQMDRMQMICHEESAFYEEMKEADIPFFIDVMNRVFDKAEAYITGKGVVAEWEEVR
jgi:hypothetical protein